MDKSTRRNDSPAQKIWDEVKDIDGKTIPPEIIENSNLYCTIIDLRAIMSKLDKIIELLSEDPNGKLSSEEAWREYYPFFGTIEMDADGSSHYNRTLICNCGDHQHGELTGGWWCPIHGHCF